jgi:hypothetical protein
MRIIITVSCAAESVMEHRPMRIIPSVSCAAESVMEQDLSLLIGPLYADQ